MSVLLLGASGFVATHLARELAARGHALEGWSRRATHEPAIGLTRRVDLLEPGSYGAFRGPWSAAVVLAGHTVPGAAWNSARVRENVLVTGHALDHLARVQPGLRVLVMSSMHVYAHSREPLREDDALAPTSAYGHSKLHIEAWARARAGALAITLVRSFHQIGPAMAPGLLVPDLVAALSSSDVGPLVLRGPDSVRDFLDVRDGARALATLLERAAPPPGRCEVLNLGSGKGTRVSRIARGLASRLAPGRPVEFQGEAGEPWVACVSRLQERTGFQPGHELDSTFDWIAAQARETVDRGERRPRA